MVGALAGGGAGGPAATTTVATKHAPSKGQKKKAKPTRSPRELTELLRQDCGSCHGLTMKGGLGPALLPDRMARYGKASLVAIMRNGVAHTAMPAWRDELSVAEAEFLAERLIAGLPEPEFREAEATVAPLGLRGTGDLGCIIERASGTVVIVETTTNSILGEVTGLGDLSHASIVFSRDQRYAYVFGRDGGLTKIDLLGRRIVRRVIQGGNSIGGAISQDGKWVAVSNYEPGGVRIFDSDTLDLVADVPATGGSKTVGLVEAPDHRFVWSLFDSDEIWVARFRGPGDLTIHKFTEIGAKPYDAMITPDGRHYVAGLFGEDGMALIDLWDLESGVRRVVDEQGRGDEKLPVYKMPHLEGWAMTNAHSYLPAVGRNRVLCLDGTGFKVFDRVDVHGRPVFVVAAPDGRRLWVNFAYPDNGVVQVIDTQSRRVVKRLEPGPGVMHMEFTPKGERIWISVRDANKVEIYDAYAMTKVGELPVTKPSGIFFTHRAGQLGK
ncbi:cytochrome D1 domain-containing protein [Sulfidibacter corallicola]